MQKGNELASILRIRLHRDWWRILTRAWSVRLMALALLFGGHRASTDSPS